MLNIWAFYWQIVQDQSSSIELAQVIVISSWKVRNESCPSLFGILLWRKTSYLSKIKKKHLQMDILLPFLNNNERTFGILMLV